jgi:hypothetical protein
LRCFSEALFQAPSCVLAGRGFLLCEEVLGGEIFWKNRILLCGYFFTLGRKAMLSQYEQNRNTVVVQVASAASDVIRKEMLSVPEQKNISDSVQDWMSGLTSPIPISERPNMQEIVDIVRIVRASSHE